MRSLHDEIMNLPIGGNGVAIAREALTDSGGVHIAYKIGHRDARHAAAELANKYDDYHERLVEALRNTQELLDNLQEHSCACNFFISEDHKCGVCKSADDNRTLLAQLQAEKGGE